MDDLSFQLSLMWSYTRSMVIIYDMKIAYSTTQYLIRRTCLANTGILALANPVVPGP